MYENMMVIIFNLQLPFQLVFLNISKIMFIFYKCCQLWFQMSFCNFCKLLLRSFFANICKILFQIIFCKFYKLSLWIIFLQIIIFPLFLWYTLQILIFISFFFFKFCNKKNPHHFWQIFNVQFLGRV